MIFPSLLIISCFSGQIPDEAILDQFGKITSTDFQGLRLKIVSENSILKYGLPFVVFIMFENCSDEIKSFLYSESFESTYTKFNWEIQDNFNLSTASTQIGTIVNLLPKSCLLTTIIDNMLPLGRYRMRIKYELKSCSSTYKQIVVGGILTSNEILLEIKKPDNYSDNDINKITTEINDHMSLLNGSNRNLATSAEAHLIILSEFSVPVMRKELINSTTNINYQKNILSTLQCVAHPNNLNFGLTRNMDALPEIIQLMNTSKNNDIKSLIISVICFYDDKNNSSYPDLERMLINCLHDPLLSNAAMNAIFSINSAEGQSAIKKAIADGTIAEDSYAKLVTAKAEYDAEMAKMKDETANCTGLILNSGSSRDNSFGMGILFLIIIFALLISLALAIGLRRRFLAKR